MRDALSELLGFLKFKVDNDVMTMEDVEGIFRLFEGGLKIKGTVKDLAGYYHQSEDNVRHVIHRNLMPEPERRVYYDFLSFRDNVPVKWHDKSLLPAD